MSQSLLQSQLLLQVAIVVAFGAFCFGCGYLTAFIVTRNKWRDAMIKRGIARYNWQTGKWEWGGPAKSSRDIEVGKEKATVTEEGLVASSQKAGSIGSLI